MFPNSLLPVMCRECCPGGRELMSKLRESGPTHTKDNEQNITSTTQIHELWSNIVEQFQYTYMVQLVHPIHIGYTLGQCSQQSRPLSQGSKSHSRRQSGCSLRERQRKRHVRSNT